VLDVVIVEDNEELIVTLAKRKQLMRDIDFVDARIRVLRGEIKDKVAAPSKKKQKRVGAADLEAEEVRAWFRGFLRIHIYRAPGLRCLFVPTL
jgi:hypothetical protein